MATTDRKPWKLGEIAREFHRRKHFAPYTMVWKKTLEGDMMDESLPVEMRVIIAIRHFAWGNFSDWAVEGPPSKETPRQMTQDSLARILNISKSQMSKACTFLKGQGFLRKDHIFLYPEDHISPLESANDSGVSSDSGNQSSSFLRYKESYLAENKELAESIAKMKDERKRLQDDALEISRELRRAQVPILTAWREAIKQETQQNQQDTPDSGNPPDQTRLYAHAQNETCDSGEHKANNGFISTESYTEKAVSDSTKKRFPTPDMPVPESGDDLVSKPNKNRNGKPGALKSLNSLKGNPQDVKTTTTVEATVKSSPSSPSSLAVPDEWRDGLAGIFTRAHKPAPLPAQTAAAYSEIAEDWKAFLKWLPGCPQFKRTHHPGGLPSLIQFFIADRQPAPAVADPETLTKEEMENYWKSRFEQNPVERKDIASMFPEIFKMEVA